MPIQFINDDIEKLNSDLSEGRYFYTDIKEQGIMLYDSKNYKLEPARTLDFEEIRRQAQEYFDDKMRKVTDFLIDAKSAFGRGSYAQSSFYLHQTCENLFYTLRLVHTLKNSKQHNLSKLLNSTNKYSPELKKIFPQKEQEDKRLFELLRLAYVEARYNPKFVVTQTDIDALLPKVEKLRKVVENVCQAQIESYKQKEK